MVRGQRNHAVDLMKGIAIILVLITHFEWSGDERHFFIFPYVVNMAVPIFMIITGYVYSNSIKRRNIDSFEEEWSLILFMRRVIRYTIPFLIVVLWELLDSKKIKPEEPVDMVKWIINGAGGPGSFYYPVMMQMIIVIPAIHVLVKKYKLHGLVMTFLLNLLYEILAWSYVLPYGSYRLICLRYIFLVSVGVYSYYDGNISFKQGFAVTLIGAAFIWMITYYGYTPIILDNGWETTNCICGLVVAPTMIWYLQNVKAEFAPLELIGKASYNIFFVQMVYYSCYDIFIMERFSSWKVQLPLSMIICITIGILFYIIETPITSFVIEKTEKVLNRFYLV